MTNRDFDELPFDWLARRLEVRIDLVGDEPLRPGSSILAVDEPWEVAPHMPPLAPGEDVAEHVGRLARDDEGRPFLPGTGLAGCLSSMVERRLGRTVPELFGEIDGDTGTPSALRFADTVLMDVEGGPVTRVRTPLDRQRAAAAHGLLHSAEETREGVRCEAHLTLLGPDETSEAALAELLDEVLVEGIHIGRGAKKGLGHLRVTGVSIDEVDLSKPEPYQAWLLHRHDLPEPGALIDRPWAHPIDDPDVWIAARLGRAETGQGTGLRPWGGVRFELRLTPSEPIAVVPPLPAGADPRVPDRFEATRLIGALRTRAERIVRTMAPSLDVWESARFTLDRDAPTHDDTTDPATDLFGSTGSAARLRISSAPLDDAVQQRFDGVAIDRFTGGAADELKFETLAVTGGTITVSITLEGAHPEHVGLTTLLIGDLADGDLPIGRRTRSGFGALSLERLSVSARGRDLPVALEPAGGSGWSELATTEVGAGGPGDRAALIAGLGPEVGDWLGGCVERLVARWEEAS
jgi:CRISPR/Cas system CSM-associated protein Csm3 (group 7 of RAMP superfamily)